MILKTYSSLEVDRASRWQDTGIRDEFFTDFDAEKHAVLEH